MIIDFQITGADRKEFKHYFKLDDDQLKVLDAVKEPVTVHPGFPCIVSLEDAEVGEEVILCSYYHHPVASPYQSAGPVFVREHVDTALLPKNKIPENLNSRMLSLRAYDAEGMMVGAATTEGTNLYDFIQDVFKNDAAQYIHVHISGPGCYNCTVKRS